VEHDQDDPVPPVDYFWAFMNRWAEESLRYFRLFGFE
jgi:hypothetical protein